MLLLTTHIQLLETPSSLDMLALKSPVSQLWFLLSKACVVMAQSAGDDARSLAAALQNINGMSSIISLLPVLSGKTQNIKAIAARTFPGSLAVMGLGAGRVLSKLQVGFMLLSADLYRNLIGELSYYHHEYVNVFSPSLVHVPTGTPERHASNVIVNHNITEDYMVEAWFQTQGLPAKVELAQTNSQRAFCGLLFYLLLYSIETFLAVENAATGTAIPLIILQTISATGWMVALFFLQATRGQGKPVIHLNRLTTAEYRCFQLTTSGKHVRSALLSIQLSNIREYNLFDSKYECKRLRVVGGAMVVSAIIDIFATVLIVGLTAWAYGWLAFEVFLIALKVFFSLEPIRRIPIVSVQPLVDDGSGQASVYPTANMPGQGGKNRLPITVETTPDFSFREIRVSHNVVVETVTGAQWHSRTAGLFVGQPYYIQRPPISEKTSIDSGESMPILPRLRMSPSFDKGSTISEKSSDPTMFPLPPSPPVSSCTSPTSSSFESESTVMPSGHGQSITEVPRIIVSPESPVVASPVSSTSPISLISPPGLPLSRTTSTRSGSTRAPTPPAKHPMRSGTPPARGPPPVSIVTRSGPNGSYPGPHQPLQPHPARSRSQTRSKPFAAYPPPSPPPTHDPPPIPSANPTINSNASPKQDSAPATDATVRYLALGRDGRLTLSVTEPPQEPNQALQREFLACLAEVVKANKVPSAEFLRAVETMREGIRSTMGETWYAFGTTDLVRYLRVAHQDVLWRRFV